MSDEERRIYNAEYYKDHKDEINKKKRERITCKCGNVVSSASYKRHLRSNLHASNLKQMAYDQCLIDNAKKMAKKKM